MVRKHEVGNGWILKQFTDEFDRHTVSLFKMENLESYHFYEGKNERSAARTFNDILKGNIKDHKGKPISEIIQE